MKKNKKTSVQISSKLHDDLKIFCEQNGYKMSGVVEIGIKSFISGSKGFSPEMKNTQLLQE